jgi:hypothetical protein
VTTKEQIQDQLLSSKISRLPVLRRGPGKTALLEGSIERRVEASLFIVNVARSVTYGQNYSAATEEDVPEALVLVDLRGWED